MNITKKSCETNIKDPRGYPKSRKRILVDSTLSDPPTFGNVNIVNMSATIAKMNAKTYTAKKISLALFLLF